jgi:hypothetical protein
MGARMKCDDCIYAGIAIVFIALLFFASPLIASIVICVFGLSLVIVTCVYGARLIIYSILSRIALGETEHFVIGLIITIIASIAIAAFLASCHQVPMLLVRLLDI